MHENTAIRKETRINGESDWFCVWKNPKRTIGVLYSNSEEEKSPIRAILDKPKRKRLSGLFLSVRSRKTLEAANLYFFGFGGISLRKTDGEDTVFERGIGLFGDDIDR